MSTVLAPASGVIQIERGPVTIAYSGVELGNVDARPGFDTPENAINREKLLRGLLVAKYALQIPQTRAEFLDLSDVSDEDIAAMYPTDGLIVNRPGVVLGLNPADCNAMTIFDTTGTAAALIHAGRQGVDGDIHLASLTTMMDSHHIVPENVRIHFGPSIRKESYYYPCEGFSAEQLADPKWNRFIDKRSGNYHIDLLGRIVKDVVEMGIDPSQIEINPIDTGSDTRYFSHIRSKRTGEPIGRNGHVVMLKP